MMHPSPHNLESKSGDMNQDTALALLQAASATSEEESDAVVKQFMDKEVVIDAFLEQFIRTRKTMHLRKLKADKMIELIRQSKQSVDQHRPYSGFYPAPAMPYPPVGGGAVPYPMGPMMGMPMPGQFGAQQ